MGERAAALGHRDAAAQVAALVQDHARDRDRDHG
jgi:hypothetical protein